MRHLYYHYCLVSGMVGYMPCMLVTLCATVALLGVIQGCYIYSSMVLEDQIRRAGT